MTTQYKIYPYRWVVLAVFMLVNVTIQILWISYAPITGPAARFYGVSDLQIGLLSMSFMIAFIPLSIPVSWVIDTYGFRLAVGIGAVMMGIFGIMRGMAGTNYTLVLWSTFGIAAAQSQAEDITKLFIENYKLFIEGKPLKYQVDFQRGY